VPVVDQRLRRIPQSSTTGLSVLRESLEEFDSNLPFPLFKECFRESVASLEFGESSICDFESCLLDEVGGQGAEDVVADAICEPDQVIKSDVVLLVEVAEAVDNQVLQWVCIVDARQDVCLKEVSAATFVGWGFRVFVVQPGRKLGVRSQ
jgi:hypothetical protein